MRKFVIGIDNNGYSVEVDLDKFLLTRGLIQANSGGGKSNTARVFLEETHGLVQHIVIDPEGEFYTLRSKYEYVVIGGLEGDIPLTLEMASLLPEKLLSMGANTILDLYEFPFHLRKEFVRRFLNALTNIKKELWNPLLVVIDEAHIFAPEKGSGEAVSSEAMKDFVSRARKRNFCPLLLTQRVSKLSKDVTAELNNRFIGRAVQDVDMKRSGEELGFNSKEQILSLRKLKAGSFFAFGTAVSDEVLSVQINKAKTNTPKVGIKTEKVKAASANIKEMLGKLSDLPKEAEKKEKTIQELQKENSELKRVNSNLSKAANKVEIKVEKEIQYIPIDLQQIESAYKALLQEVKKIDNAITDLKTQSKAKTMELRKQNEVIREQEKIEKPIKILNLPASNFTESDFKFSLCEKNIIRFLQSNPNSWFTKEQVAIASSYSVTSGSFLNSLSSLNTKGIIKREGSKIQFAWASIFSFIPSDYEFNIENVKKMLNKCELEILEVFLVTHGLLTKEQIANQTQSKYSVTSGSFNNSLSKLCTLGLLSRSGGTLSKSLDLKELLGE